MSLDVTLVALQPVDVFTANLTSNLCPMAEAAGIYNHLWHPEKIGIAKAGDLVAPLKVGLEKLKADPEKYKGYEPKNGWGSYEHFVHWLGKYIESCEANPTAEVHVSI